MFQSLNWVEQIQLIRFVTKFQYLQDFYLKISIKMTVHQFHLFTATTIVHHHQVSLLPPIVINQVLPPSSTITIIVNHYNKLSLPLAIIYCHHHQITNRPSPRTIITINRHVVYCQPPSLFPITRSITSSTITNYQHQPLLPTTITISYYL